MNKPLVLISRTIMIVLSIVSIFGLLAVRMWERAGGGTQKIKHIIFPLIVLLILCAVIFFWRITQRKIKSLSVKALTYIESAICLVSVLFIILTIIDMVSYSFSFGALVFLLLLLIPPVHIVLSNRKELKVGNA